MEEFVPPDILAMLQPQVGVDYTGNLPKRNTSDASLRCRHSSGEGGADDYGDILNNVFYDQNKRSALNFAQSEKVATKVLKGEYKISEKFESIGAGDHHYDPFHHQAHSKANLRRHKISNNMFELTSQSAPFHPADPEARKALAYSRTRELGHGPQFFVSLGAAVPAVPLHVPLHKEPQRAVFPRKTEVVAQKILLDAEKVKQFRSTVVDQKREYTLQKQRHIEVKKKLAAFKEKLYRRLREKHDPQLSAVMRTLDDAVILRFIEAFKGCTMSIDAILLHIGANIPPSASATDAEMLEHAAPEVAARKFSNANGYRLIPRGTKCQGAGFRLTSRNKSTASQPQLGGRGDTGDSRGGERAASPSMYSVNTLHQHLSSEHLLPSMQPDKAISDEDLRRLGTHSASCDDLRHSQRPLGKVEAGSRRAPRSLKTRSRQPTDPHSHAASPLSAPVLPALSSTDYGGLYVISSYKENLNGLQQS